MAMGNGVGGVGVGGVAFLAGVVVMMAIFSFTLVDVMARISTGASWTGVATDAAVVAGSSLVVPHALAHAAEQAMKRAKTVGKKAREKLRVPSGDDVHVVVTTNGSPYVNFQTRILYGSFLRMQRMQGGERFRFFTRVLSRATDDALMSEVPTVRVAPLTPECDTWCAFPVADRPHSIRLWLETEDSKRAEWVLLVESDYVFAKPMPLPEPMKNIAFRFDYINPPAFKDILEPLGDGINANTIYRSGPAPALLRTRDWRALIDRFESVTGAVEANEKSRDKMGWLREMYTFSLAAKASGVDIEIQPPQSTVLISQPPASDTLEEGSMYHYTWSCEVLSDPKDIKSVVWRWDKRRFTGAAESFSVPQLPPPPEQLFLYGNYTLVFPKGKVFTKALGSTMAHMIGIMNEVIETLPSLEPCGWNGFPLCDTTGKPILGTSWPPP